MPMVAICARSTRLANMAGWTGQPGNCLDAARSGRCTTRPLAWRSAPRSSSPRHALETYVDADYGGVSDLRLLEGIRSQKAKMRVVLRCCGSEGSRLRSISGSTLPALHFSLVIAEPLDRPFEWADAAHTLFEFLAHLQP